MVIGNVQIVIQKMLKKGGIALNVIIKKKKIGYVKIVMPQIIPTDGIVIKKLLFNNFFIYNI